MALTPEQMRQNHIREQQAIREALQRKASDPVETRQMSDLAGEIKKHLSRPNVIPLEILIALFIKENFDKLPFNKKKLYSDWYLRNVDPYRPVEIVTSFNNPAYVIHNGERLKLPAQFSGEYQPLKGDLKSDTILQQFHRDAVDGAFPKHASIATKRLDEAMSAAQLDPENLKKIGCAMEETKRIMHIVRSYLNPNHPSYIKPVSSGDPTKRIANSPKPASKNNLDDFEFDD